MRAELAGILEAILISPTSSIVNIYTDSQAAIQGIKAVRKSNTPRLWYKIKNSGLLSKIDKKIRVKELKLSLHKIKAHSGIPLNEKVDL